MKYQSNQKLYYSNPFSFTIEQVEIMMGVIGDDFNPDIIYYIDMETGAYLAENDLFLTLNEAKQETINRLNKFYEEKLYYIVRTNL